MACVASIRAGRARRQMLDRDRFWYNRYADWRGTMFERLSALVTRASALRNPMVDAVKQ